MRLRSNAFKEKISRNKKMAQKCQKDEKSEKVKDNSWWILSAGKFSVITLLASACIGFSVFGSVVLGFSGK